MKTSLQKFNITIKGTGDKVVIFAHGFGCDQNAWRRITPELELSHKLILFDFIGAGKTDVRDYDEAKYSTLHGYANDVIEICEYLDISNAFFVGHSVSCVIGILASIKRPNLFNRLILIGPSPCYINDGEYTGGFEEEDIRGLLELMDDDYVLWANTMAPAIMENTDTPSLGKELSDSFCSMDPTIAKAFARVTFLSDNRSDLPSVNVETITLQCADDIIAPAAVGDYINAVTPKNKLVKLEATGHCPHMSAPAEIIKVLKRYI